MPTLAIPEGIPTREGERPHVLFQSLKPLGWCFWTKWCRSARFCSPDCVHGNTWCRKRQL